MPHTVLVRASPTHAHGIARLADEGAHGRRGEREGARKIAPHTYLRSCTASADSRRVTQRNPSLASTNAHLNGRVHPHGHIRAADRTRVEPNTSPMPGCVNTSNPHSNTAKSARQESAGWGLDAGWAYTFGVAQLQPASGYLRCRCWWCTRCQPRGTAPLL